MHFDAVKTREETHNQSYILNLLRKGNSFLTNGPILVSRVAGKYPGERVKVSDNGESLDIDLKILANRKLKTLEICTENGVRKQIALKGKKTNGFYDYSMKLEEAPLEDNYMYFTVMDDCTNLAITNPVIFVR